MAISDEEPILVNTPQTLEQMSVEELEAHAFALRLFRCHKSVPDALDTNTCFTMAMFMSA